MKKLKPLKYKAFKNIIQSAAEKDCISRKNLSLLLGEKYFSIPKNEAIIEFLLPGTLEQAFEFDWDEGSTRYRFKFNLKNTGLISVNYLPRVDTNTIRFNDLPQGKEIKNLFLLLNNFLKKRDSNENDLDQLSDKPKIIEKSGDINTAFKLPSGVFLTRRCNNLKKRLVLFMRNCKDADALYVIVCEKILNKVTSLSFEKDIGEKLYMELSQKILRLAVILDAVDKLYVAQNSIKLRKKVKGTITKREMSGWVKKIQSYFSREVETCLNEISQVVEQEGRQLNRDLLGSIAEFAFKARRLKENFTKNFDRVEWLLLRYHLEKGNIHSELGAHWAKAAHEILNTRSLISEFQTIENLAYYRSEDFSQLYEYYKNNFYALVKTERKYRKERKKLEERKQHWLVKSVTRYRKDRQKIYEHESTVGRFGEIGRRFFRNIKDEAKKTGTSDEMELVDNNKLASVVRLRTRASNTKYLLEWILKLTGLFISIGAIILSFKNQEHFEDNFTPRSLVVKALLFVLFLAALVFPPSKYPRDKNLMDRDEKYEKMRDSFKEKFDWGLILEKISDESNIITNTPN